MTDAVMGPSADPVARKDERDTYDLRKRQLAADTIAVCSSPEGQRFLAWLLDDLGMFKKPPFTDSVRLAAMQEARRVAADGIRSVILGTHERNWFAIEREIVKRNTEPVKQKPKEKDDDSGS